MAVFASRLPTTPTASAMALSFGSRCGDVVGKSSPGFDRSGRGAGGGGRRSDSLGCVSSSFLSCSLCGASMASRCSTSASTMLRDGCGGPGESMRSSSSFFVSGGLKQDGGSRRRGRFDSDSVRIGLQGRAGAYQAMRKRIVICSGSDRGNKNSDDDQVETLFMRELRRRGLSTKQQEGKSGGPSGATGTDTTTKQETKSSQSTRDDQMKRSMALNSEGLEGLIPRATELVKLGGTFFLGLWPFIVLVLATFLALYLYFGSGFIHTGNNKPREAERYVDPYQLLKRDDIPSSIGQSRVPFRNSRADDGST